MIANREHHEKALLCIPSYQSYKEIQDQFDKKSPPCVLTFDEKVKNELYDEGLKNVILITGEEENYYFDEIIDKVIIFEDTFSGTCKFLDVARTRMKAPIIVVTQNRNNPLMLYKLNGVHHVVYVNSHNVSFLLN